MALVQEFITGDFRIKVEKIDEGCLLLRGALQHIESDVKGLFITKLRSETDIGLGFGFIAIFSFQTRGKSGFIDLTDGRHVIVSDPLPETKLRVEENG